MRSIICGLALACLFVFAGCKSEQDVSESGTPPVGSFSLAWSEYPSWSVFGVAEELGLINGAVGELGEIERKHNVDIELREAGYDACLNMFASGNCDAVCITNMDALIVSPSRSAVAVLPTSTSMGADACLVTETIQSIEDLKQHSVYGLKGTVSEYCFARCLELEGFDKTEFNFSNQDPAIAATNMQQRAESHQAIMVWNPFVLQTLNERPDVRVLFDSSKIPGEIVDMVAIGAELRDREGISQFVAAVADAFYAVDEAIDDPTDGDEVLVELGRKFSNLGLEDMRTVVQQTVFYDDPAVAKELFSSEDFQQKMKEVSDFCIEQELVQETSYGFGEDAGANPLNFDASMIP